MSSENAYIRLIRTNSNFRNLWISQSIANFGDWFGMLAIYALIQQYTDSEILIGLIIVVKLMSFSVFSPVAGYLTDRYSRKKLMFWCDIGRAGIVLLLLLVQNETMLPLVYVLISIQMMMAAIFEPAKSSSIPNITSREELVTANVISTLSWSIIFTLGMAIGGFATAAFGIAVVFVLNALTYLVSAIFIQKTQIPYLRTREELESMTSPLDGIRKGFIFLRGEQQILRPALAKAWLEISIGALVYMLILIADDILMMGSIGLGLLYASRGLGTAIGPVVIRRFFPDETKWIQAIGICMALVGFGYMLVGLTSTVWIMMILVVFAHAGSGANWVISTILIQKRTPDEYRGRVFSTEWLIFTLVESVSVMIAASLLYFNIISLSGNVILFGALLVVASIFWHLIITRRERGWQQKVLKDITVPEVQNLATASHLGKQKARI
ncbi:MAG: major facilitator superfamily transporter [Bacteroidetes bacterium HLUCCA01]|nr:MAG: major facilitator superfamily transporter [Bacteroidetes bacterium HLUCCA01]